VDFERARQGLPFITPSRLFVYYNERATEETIASDAGAQIRDGAKVIAAQGACPETDWPYDPAQFAVEPPDAAYSDGLQDIAVQYQSVAQSAHFLKSALAGGLPVVIGISVYESFESDAVAATGTVPMPDEATEQLLGGHAVLLVGYDDATSRWLVRNSWGDTWGQAGYFTLPYAYLTDPQLASDFWVLQQVGPAACETAAA
jgi:C1A family cysteine protease